MRTGEALRREWRLSPRSGLRRAPASRRSGRRGHSPFQRPGVCLADDRHRRLGPSPHPRRLWTCDNGDHLQPHSHELRTERVYGGRPPAGGGRSYPGQQPVLDQRRPSLLLTIGFAAAGPLLGWFYGDPRVAAVAGAVALPIFLTRPSVLHPALL